MVKQHLKRLSSPRTWPIERKNLVFVARPNPGPHSMDFHIAMTVFLKELAGVVKTTKEVKHILHSKDCFIDGVNCYDDKRPVGLLDVVSLPKAGLFYRVSINKNNNLSAVLIPEKEANTKIVKIVSKTSLKKGGMQLGTNDGRSFRVDDLKKYSVGDSLLIELPSQKINAHLPLKPGVLIFLKSGRNVGVIGNVESIEKDIITVKANGQVFRTKKDFAIAVGSKDKPLITLLSE